MSKRLYCRPPSTTELRTARPWALPGEELWCYTCLAPQGPYPNRFLDFSSLKTRIIHWLNWRYGSIGYLHWGYAAWHPWGGLKGRVDPWNSATGGSEKLPWGGWACRPATPTWPTPGRRASALRSVGRWCAGAWRITSTCFWRRRASGGPRGQRGGEEGLGGAGPHPRHAAEEPLRVHAK